MSRSYSEFWDTYVFYHRRRGNRLLHCVGTTLAVAFLTYGLVARNGWGVVMAPLVGYGFAWIGHFWIERNRPATFQHPWWSLRADLQMVLFICLGRMSREVKRVEGQRDRVL